MPLESPRIAELRRRVEADPASIAFAQLAEEYRRAGNFEAAEQCCRAGLVRHPGYLSARVTLGRTLIELGHLDQAEQELSLVLNSAPDNLTAIRGMAEINQLRGNLASALEWYRRALPLARHDPDLEETVSQIDRELGAMRHPQTAAGLSFAEATNELLAAASRMPDVRRPEPVVAPADPAQGLPQDTHDRFGGASPATARPPEPAPAPRQAARVAPVPGTKAPKADDGEPSIDFDHLLKSLGVMDQSAPPMVEALLTEPAPTPPRPEPILPELPIEPPAGDPFAALEQGLRDFDQPSPSPVHPPSLAPTTDASVGVAGHIEPASARPESDASHGVASQGETSPERPEIQSREGAPGAPVAPAASASARTESQASYGETSPKRPEIQSREGGPEADKTEQMIVDELEAWLAAIKR